MNDWEENGVKIPSYEQALKKQGASAKKAKKVLQVGQSVRFSHLPTGYACWEGEWQGMGGSNNHCDEDCRWDLFSNAEAQEAKQQVIVSARAKYVSSGIRPSRKTLRRSDEGSRVISDAAILANYPRDDYSWTGTGAIQQVVHIKACSHCSVVFWICTDEYAGWNGATIVTFK